jgi:hypothetical protein
MRPKVTPANSIEDDVRLFEHEAAAAGVPVHLVGGFARYVFQGLPPGHFLTAVLENDLMEAMSRADEKSRAGLFALCSFIYNHLPQTAWGSPERVETWIRERRDALRAREGVADAGQ